MTITHDPVSGGVIDNIVISWSPSAYNSTYRLFKMNASGNWVKITEIKSNNSTITFNWVDPSTGLTILPKVDTDGITPIYHRFKVTVENSSGLLNLTDNEFAI